MKLDEKIIRSVKATDKRKQLADGGGLYLEVMPTGKKFWRQNYRYEGKARTLTHGLYPDISISIARRKREEVKYLLLKNLDPAENISDRYEQDIEFLETQFLYKHQNKRKIIIAITGASGSIYGIKALKELKNDSSIETHLIVSSSGYLNIISELGIKKSALKKLADVVHSEKDVGASIASGSFKTSGMIIAPCSMKSLAAIANGYADNLISRAADVTLKERRKLLLVVRETPFNLAHLKNMTSVTQMGGLIFPPVPSFYAKLNNLDEMVDQTVGRILDYFDIDTELLRRWEGIKNIE
ncbi:MAG: hypothetical protein CBC38_04295 [Gammaproteobacteria bacterium TMED78]|nr:MAG: hypothetical protein CBC38_04295 [Gammaproteobacteria bacterium TMED78]|tara:strand:- start:87632 stop:88525 length:894 start_codon:yes stop_codon:yes gene_type:complete